MIVSVTETCGSTNDTYFVDINKFPVDHAYIKAVTRALAVMDQTGTVSFDDSFSFGSRVPEAIVTLPAMVEAHVKLFVDWHGRV